MRLRLSAFAAVMCLTVPGAAFGDGPSSPVLAGSLIVPSEQILDGGQQLRAAQQATASSPGAVAARAASQTAFEGLGASAASKLVSESFPRSLGQPAGGPPPAISGTKLTEFVGPDAARVDLGGGKHGVVESAAPMAVLAAEGHWAPINLALRSTGGGFEPVETPAPLTLPKHVGDGISLPNDFLSLTPINANGSPVAGSEGAVQGATVFYANIAPDTDAAVKPTPAGFEEDTFLRSQESPDELRFRVEVPAGATLESSPQGVGPIIVREEGSVIAKLLPPTAWDAAGTAVPVSMTVSGDIVVLHVSAPSGEYQYPIEVDPTVYDTTLGDGGLTWDTNWRYIHNTEEFGTHFWAFDEGPSGWQIYNDGTKAAGGWGALVYPTQGLSTIWALTTTSSASDTGSGVSNYFDIANSSGWETSAEMPATYAPAENLICVTTCDPGYSTWTNEAQYLQYGASAGVGGENKLSSATVWLYQEQGPKAEWNVSEEYLNHGEPWAYNVVTTSHWLSPGHGALEAKANDPGLGISQWEMTTPSSPSWSLKGEVDCSGVQCDPNADPFVTWWSGYYENSWEGSYHALPDGEPEVFLKFRDPIGDEAQVHSTIKVDGTAPHGITLAGLPAGNELGDRTYQVTGGATDGSGATPSSGVASLALSIDGREVGKAGGSCSPGPCGANATWTLNPREVGAGKHVLTVAATDNAGNVGKEEFPITVHHAEPVAFGPGSVNPVSGEYSLSATDVNVSAGTGSMTVGRSYRSQSLAAGAEGPVGAPWGMDLGGEESLTKLANGNMTLTASSGAQTTFTSKGGGAFSSPVGDVNLVLKAGKAGEYLLETPASAAKTRFTVPSGGTGTTYVPTIAEGPVATETVTYAYQTVEVGGKKITEPTEELAPVPAGVSCAPKLERGCRALTFAYATEGTPSGEARKEWGEFAGHLTSVSLTAWNPASKEMQTTAVAQYAYDKQGRLRAEWDPRISPALKTTYGYDPEGHITAITPPGGETSTLTYGTTSSDASPGRLLKTTQGSATTEVWNGEPVTNTVAPTVSISSPVMGKAVSVANGTWSNGPVSYGYQWEDCNTEGKACSVIPGAVNPSYTPVASDGGYALVAQVTAANGDGTVVASTSPSSVVASPAPTFSSQFGSEGSTGGQLSGGNSTAVDANGNLWVTDTGNNRLEEFSPSGSFVAVYGWGVSDGASTYEICKASCRAGIAGSGAGQFSGPWGIAINRSTGSIYVSDQSNFRIEEFSSAGAYIGAWGKAGSGPGQFSTLAGLAVDAGGNVWVTDFGNDRLQEFDQSGNFTRVLGSAGTGNGQFTNPVGIVFLAGNMYVSDYSNNRIEEFSPEGTYLRQFGSVGSGNGQFKGPYAIAAEPAGSDVYVTDAGNNRAEIFNASGTYLGQFGAAGKGSGQFSSPRGIVFGAPGEALVLDSSNNRVQKWTSSNLTQEPVPTPPAPTANSVSTIEYNVPVSGSGAPHAMGAKEVEGWGQKDDPVEATAIFPPDKPEGWPASGYERATVLYRDASARQVNTANPSGGITTTEYNATNDVVRSLSAVNRVTALKEGGKSAEVSHELDTQSTYNEEGTELLSTLGPAHQVKLSTGSEVLARAHTVDSYNEGAPTEGGPYSLLTKTTQGALIGGKEELEVRTTTTSYKGQNGLGWLLRKPTSVTTDPSGLKLVHTTEYNSVTGQVTETRTPGAGAGKEEICSGGCSTTGEYTLALTFGSAGSKEGQFTEPYGVAVNAAGDTYVADAANNRIQEFGPTGKFIAAFGFGVSNGEAKYEICKSSCRAGTAGAGNGQFSGPKGVAIDEEGNIWVVDTGNSRIQRFTAAGEYVTKFGTVGAGNEQFKAPVGLAISKAYVFVSDTGNSRIDQYERSGKSQYYRRSFAREYLETGWVKAPRGIALGPEGNVYVADTGDNKIQEYNTGGTFLSTIEAIKSPTGIVFDGLGHMWVTETTSRVVEMTAQGKTIDLIGKEGSGTGQVKGPLGLASDGKGDIWIVDAGNSRVQEWSPTGHESKGNGGAHGAQTVYYASGSETSVAACNSHPEWAGLPCQTQPAAQPETSGLPNLPVTTVTYNIWNEIEAGISVSGTATRKGTTTYDAAGRPLATEVTSSVGAALPKVSNEYNTETGALTRQSSGAGAEERKVSSILNKLGQLTSYTDADGNTSTYEYDEDGRTKKVNDGKGTQTYSYDAVTGELTKLTDSAAGTFTASYDPEGNLSSQTYPNGMSANYGYNPVGEATLVEYVKNTHCTEKCTWFSDSLTSSIHGETLGQTSTLSSENYAYDNDGRLTQTQETSAGKGCTTRIYGYDADTNRTSLTTREPGAKGECTTTGGIEQAHTYDTADRLLDTGVAYDAFGNTTTLPASDAGGSELTSTFYDDDQLATQTQNGETIGYYLDPAGRTREMVSTGKTAADVISHYAGGSSSPAWTVEPSTGHWTRMIRGIAGFAATETNGESPILQIEDLRGNIVGTASLSETATKLLSTEASTEYGVPTTSTPPKYSWLGGEGTSTEFPSGVTAMGARSYVPELGRFLQTDPRPGGSANAYAYTDGNPVDSSDPSGEWTVPTPEWTYAVTSREGKAAVEAAARRAAEEAAARRAAEEAAAAAGAAAGASSPPEAGAVPLGGSELWADEYGVETGQLPSGIDPYLGHGVYLAILLTSHGLEFQIHFDETDSLAIAAGTTTAAGYLAGTALAENPPVAAAAVAGVAAFGSLSASHILKHNCIGVGVYVGDSLPKGEYYRSKKECG